MPMQLDKITADLLELLQQEIPLIERPFAELGREIGLPEDEVIVRIAELRGPGGVIRQIGGIFDSRALGYQSCLLAAKVDTARLDEAAAEISSHPGVLSQLRAQSRLQPLVHVGRAPRQYAGA